MTLNELRARIQERELKVGEVLSGAMALMERRMGQYFLLAVLIFLPSSLIVELFYSTIPAEPSMEEAMRLYVVQLSMNLFTMISLCITAHIVQNQLQTDEADSFGTSFYRGICQWPRFLVTMLIVGLILGAVIFGIMMVGMMMPFLLVPALAFVVIVIVIGVVLIYDVCIAASLRRYILMPCFNYVRAVLQDHIGKSVGVVLLLTLISALAATPIVALISTLMTLLNNPVLTIIVNTIVNTLVGIVNIYTNIGAVIFFMNLEMLKYKELGAIE